MNIQEVAIKLKEALNAWGSTYIDLRDPVERFRIVNCRYKKSEGVLEVGQLFAGGIVIRKFDNDNASRILGVDNGAFSSIKINKP